MCSEKNSVRRLPFFKITTPADCFLITCRFLQEFFLKRCAANAGIDLSYGTGVDWASFQRDIFEE